MFIYMYLWCFMYVLLCIYLCIYLSTYLFMFIYLTIIRYSTLLFCGSNEMELASWPWRVVFWSNAIATIFSLYFATNEFLVDMYYYHITGCIIWLLWWFNFLMCLYQSPGICFDQCPSSSSNNNSNHGYDSSNTDDVELGLMNVNSPNYSFEYALNVISESATSSNTSHLDNLPSVCYTCKIRKPLRSKHCKNLKKCIHKFDHFCPFVGMVILYKCV